MCVCGGGGIQAVPEMGHHCILNKLIIQQQYQTYISVNRVIGKVIQTNIYMIFSQITIK